MEIIKTERLQQFEDNDLLHKPLMCSATYIKNGTSNNSTCKTSLLTDIAICNTNYIIDHLWIKDSDKKSYGTIWKSKQHKTVHFVAKFIIVTKPGDLYSVKKDLNLKIIEIIK